MPPLASTTCWRSSCARRGFGTRSATTAFAAYRADDDTLMCAAEQILVLVDAEARRPVQVPDSFRTPVREFEGSDLEEVRP